MKVSKILVNAIYISSIPLLVAMFVSFPLGGYTFFSANLPTTLPTKPLPTSLPFFFFGQLFYVPLPFKVSLGEAFLAFWVLYLALFSISLLGPKKNLIQAMKSLKEEGPSAIYSNTALLLSVVFPILVLGLTTMEDILNRIGLPVGQLPEVDPRENFFLLSYSPLIEEFGFRISLIGLAAGIIGWRLIGGGKGFIKGVWHPAEVIKVKNMSQKVNAYMLPIILSSMLFGLAHIFYSTEWGPGKAVSAGFAGFVIGIVYVTNGLPAAILMHWAFNYFSASYYYFDKIRGLPPLNENPSSNIFSYSQAYVDIIVFISAISSLISLLAADKLKKVSTQHL